MAEAPLADVALQCLVPNLVAVVLADRPVATSLLAPLPFSVAQQGAASM